MCKINRFRLLLLPLLGLVLAASAIAQTSVGIVDTQRAILETAEIQKAQTAMETEFKPRQDDLQKLQQQLADYQNQLQKMAGKLTPQAERDLQVNAQRTQREMQRKSEDLETDLNNRRNDILSNVGRRMQAVVQKLAEEKGLDVVIDVNNAIYFKPALDLTQEATVAYNTAHPAQ